MAKTIDHASRDHALLSASSAELWLNCPGSALANAQYADEASDYAKEGTVAHEVAEAYVHSTLMRTSHSELAAALDGLREKWGADAVTREMLECAEGYAAYIAERITSSCVVMLEQKLDFSRWVPDGFGTGDCIIIDNSVLTIIDYKYGQGVQVESEGNPQMRLYALGAINDYGCVYDFDTVRMRIYQPRINNVSESSMSVADLLAWADEVVVPAAAEALSGEASFHAGQHCRKFCKHAGRCPELMRHCSNFVESHGLRADVPHLSDEDYLIIMQMEPLIKKWLEATTRAATNQILAGNPIAGLKVVEGRSLRKWTNDDAVYSELLRLGHDAETVLEPRKVLSVAMLEKALGKKKVAEQVGEFITRNPGKPTLVLSSDSRPDYDPGAEFEVLD